MKRKTITIIVMTFLSAVLVIVAGFLVFGAYSNKINIPSYIVSFGPQGTISERTPEIYVVFNEQMDNVSVENAFHMRADNGDVAGTFKWHDGYRSFTFTPDLPLDDGTEYSISIDGTAKTISGKTIGTSFAWSIYTPSPARSFSAVLPIVILPLLFLLLMFIVIEYSAYRRWSQSMIKRYGRNFNESDYDFLPLFKAKTKKERGLLIERGTWGAIYENGLQANFVIERHKSIRHEFKHYSEIEAIYPISFGENYTYSQKRAYDGIQIETSDLKVCIFNSRIHPLKDIIPALISEMGSRWEKVFIKDIPLTPSQLGIHNWLRTELRQKHEKSRKPDRDNNGTEARH